MVPPLAADVLLLARVLMPWSAPLRSSVARRLIQETEAAHAHWHRHGTAHPAFGDGSLGARVMALSPRPEPFANDGDFLRALRTAAGALLNHSRL